LVNSKTLNIQGILQILYREGLKDPVLLLVDGRVDAEAAAPVAAEGCEYLKEAFDPVLVRDHQRASAVLQGRVSPSSPLRKYEGTRKGVRRGMDKAVEMPD
jgi:hypothetical protein